MPVFKAQNDPMGFMHFLASSDWTKGVMEFPDTMCWSEASAIVSNVLDERLKGDFVVMLGDETKLTDRSAEFIIRTVDADDLAIVGAFMFNFRIQYPR